MSSGCLCVGSHGMLWLPSVLVQCLCGGRFNSREVSGGVGGVCGLQGFLLPDVGGEKKMDKGFGGLCCRAETEINVYFLCGMLCGFISMIRVMGCILWVGVGSIIVCSLFLFERG